LASAAVIDHPSADKEAQILAGAEAVFTRDGYGGASMSRIAAEAQVSKGTLYNYFTSKAALFETFIHRKCETVIRPSLDDDESALPPHEVLRQFGRRLVRMLVSETGLTIYRVVLAESVRFPELAQIFYAAGPGRGLPHVARLLEAASLGGDDPRFASEQLLALMQTEIVTKRRLGLLDAVSDEEIGRVVDMALRVFQDAAAARHS
jgi:AcrR family transcriptional regulator